MSLKILGLNGVRVTMAASILAADTSILINEAISPYILPPPAGADHYYLTLVDYVNRPSAWERVKVTARSASAPYSLTVERNIDSSTGAAIDFAAGSIAQWTIGAEEIQETAAAGSGKIVLASSGTAGPYSLYGLTSANAIYISPITVFDSEYTDHFIDDSNARWYNNTGASLTISNLLVSTNFFNAIGNYTFTIQVNGLSTAISVTLNAGAALPLVARDTVNTAVIADGDYLTIKVENSSATETGTIYLSNLQMVLQ